ncbi:hypothetical protein BFW38_16520 [Terasakiispira papahanaumokuakeensis]|uniref:histidine kinase n=1 Tax=Terasakiispira papahanaumokuakeensis TaxID=197479 RepID=A0A1E2VD57_9GAMM|nr:ATP-binding protein [Terasakiispira papahanaumokuakeensis]ODC04894.1 hypothetical protein BFW38_16520 [Terasakiispira papahanaumokuakeensis]
MPEKYSTPPRYEWWVWPIAILFIIGLLILNHTQKNAGLAQFSTEEMSLLSMQAAAVETSLKYPMEDLIGLRDAFEQRPADAETDNFQNTLMLIMLSNPNYTQARYIEASGQERIKLIRDKDTQAITPVVPAALENKTYRDYMRDILDLADNTIYLSRFDLNIEQGFIERPIVPTLRFAIAVHHAGKSGFLILNLNGDQLLKPLHQPNGLGQITYLINRQGDWLVGPSESMEWGFMFDQPKRFQDYPAAPRHFDAVHQETTQDALKGQDGGYWFSHAIKLSNSIDLPITTPEHLTLLRHAGPQQIALRIQGQHRYVLLAIIGLMIISAWIAFTTLKKRRERYIEDEAMRREDEIRYRLTQQLEHKVAEKTQEIAHMLTFIERLTDHLPATIAYWDSDFYCRFINASSYRWMGIKKSEAIGQHLADILGETLFTERFDIYRRALKGETLSNTLWYTRYEDQHLCLLKVIYIPVILDNEQKGFISVSDDITEAYEREQELIKRSQEAERATIAKSNFLANMSHEIRTPMNAIIGMLTLLKDTPLDLRQRNFADKAFNASSALLSILNDILDLSKLDEHKLHIEQRIFETEDLIQRSVDLFAVAAEGKGLTLNVRVDPKMPQHLYGDAFRISQILSNLIGNAIKFTEQGSITLDIQARTAHADSVIVEFMVIDTGVGMSKETQSIVFDKFSQADDSTTRQYGGSGLGLAISHQLAELMEGELTVESELNNGSTFTLKLKLKIPETTAPYHDLSLDNTVLFHRVNQQKLWPLIEEHARSWGIPSYPLPEPQTDESIERLLAHLTPSKEEGSVNQIILLDSTQTIPESLIQALVQWLKTHSPQLNHCGVILLMPATHVPEGIEPLINEGAIPIVKPPTPSRLYDAIANIALHSEARPSPTPASERPKMGKIQGPSLKVLVIDDVDINLEVAHNLLSRIGLNCDTESSPKDALSRLEEAHYDAILIDLHMAELSGFELAKTLRKTAGPNQDTLLIALTASATEQDQARAQAVGMNAYLTKPLMPDAIKQLLAEHLDVTFESSAPSEATPEPLPVSDPSGLIDFEQLNKQVGNDAELVDAYLKQGYLTLEDIAITMEEAYEDHDTDKMALLAHRLKGISGNIAALSLKAAAQSFEHSLASGLSESNWSPLRILLCQHIKVLKPYATSSTSEITDTLSHQELKQQLQQLDDQLSHHRAINQEDLPSISQTLKSMADHNSTFTDNDATQLMQLSDELEHSIQQFNYSLARSNIQTILKILNA